MNIKNILYYNEGLEYSVESKYINNKNLGFSNLNNMSALKAYEEVISGYNYIESENSKIPLYFIEDLKKNLAVTLSFDVFRMGPFWSNLKKAEACIDGGIFYQTSNKI